MSTDVLAPMFYGSPVDEIFSSGRQLREMVRFEVALAAALEEVGIAPPGTAAGTDKASASFPSVDQIEKIARAAMQSGNIAIPFVKELTSAVSEQHRPESNFVHFGATSQDVLDTSLVLQLKDFFNLIEVELNRVCEALVALTRANEDAILPGRTWMQQGPPILFAQKTAGYLSSLLRHRERFNITRRNSLTLQFGGAVGTLASLGTHGRAVAEALSSRLELRLPEIPWHTERDNMAEVATSCGLLVGSLGKIARDLSLMMQTEVAEIAEELSEGAGGSSTMPHKRNPVNAALILSAAVSVPGLVSTMLSAMVQEHERGLGGWHSEWKALPEICKLAYGALSRTANMLERLKLNREKMQSNLELLQGAAMSESVSMLLAERLGRPHAHELMEEVSRAALQCHRPLQEQLQLHPLICQHLSAEEIYAALSPANYLGQSKHYVQQVLLRAEEELARETPHAVR